jgi:hypothetical protein
MDTEVDTKYRILGKELRRVIEGKRHLCKSYLPLSVPMLT